MSENTAGAPALVRGIDTSSYQQHIQWPAVRQAGISFAITKHSEGLDYHDPTFAANWAGIREAGLGRGCYYFTDLNDPQQEALYFLSHLPALETGDVVALDIEQGTGDLSMFALSWCRTVEHALGFRPLIYTYVSFVMQSLRHPDLAYYPLWLADYSTTRRTAIGPWPEIAMWQYTSSLKVSGITGNVDGDELASSHISLKDFGKPPPTDPVWRVTKTCAVKAVDKTTGLPSHESPGVLGPDGKLYKHLVVGTVVNPIGGIIRNDNDIWQGIKIPNTGIKGYVPLANLHEF